VYHSQLLPYIEPKDSDILIVTEEDDRLDLLAYQFYGDSQLWWVIATYNNLTDIDTKLEPGLQLRIPVRASVVTQLF
jgi:phage tail protein X